MLKLTNNRSEYMKKYGLITPGATVIEYDNNIVGFVDYKETENSITILYITIQNKYKNKGIATEVINILKKKNKKIYGDATPAAKKFWSKFNPIWIDDEDDYLQQFLIQ